MPGRCVVGGCSAFPDVQNDLILHAIPFLNDERPEARKRRFRETKEQRFAKVFELNVAGRNETSTNINILISRVIRTLGSRVG